jgi:hypothetical protein
MIAAGDTVATRKTFRGTHQGQFMGIPPTGRRVAIEPGKRRELGFDVRERRATPGPLWDTNRRARYLLRQDIVSAYTPRTTLRCT